MTEPVTTPEIYITGALKQDPVTLAVAVRTNIPSVDGSFDWAVMTIDRGGHYARWEEIADWSNIPDTPVGG